MATRHHLMSNRPLTRSALLFGFAAALVFAAVAPGHAQGTSPKRGFQPGGSYAISDIEAINTTNGNMTLRVPLAKLPAGRAGLSAGISLFYNSKLYDATTSRQPDGHGGFNTLTHPRASEDGGWRYTFSYQLKTLFKYMDSEPPPCSEAEALYVYKTQVVFPDGGSHEFRPQGYRDDYDDGWFSVGPGGQRQCQTPPVNSTISFFSTDGTYLRLDVEYDQYPSDGIDPAWTLYFPDGGRVTGGGTAHQRVYDRNDNYVEIQHTTYNGHSAVKIVDQFDRKVILEYGSAANQDTVHSWGFAGEPMQTVVKWKNVEVQKTYGTDGPHPCCHEATKSFSFRSVEQVLLPEQAGTPRLAYTFGYNPGTSNPSHGWGEVSSVTLPTGAQAAYQWKWDGNPSTPPRWEDVLKNSPTRKDLTYDQQYDDSSAEVTDTWLYAINDLDALLTAPDGGVTREYWYGAPSNEMWKDRLVYKSEGADGTIVERKWAPNTPYISYSGTYGPKYFNPVIEKEFTSIRDAAGALVKTAVKDYKYDKNGNVTEVKEYDWVSYGSVPRDAQGRPTGVPAGASLKRVTTNSYYNPTPDSSDTSTDDPDTYHKATAHRVRNALEATEVGDGVQTLTRTEVFYDDASTKANPTGRRSWDSHKGGAARPLTRPLGHGGADNYVSTSQQYDAYGNPTLSTDANGNQTLVTYEPVGGFSGLYPTTVETAYGTAVERTSASEYDFHTGAVTRTTDVDNAVSTATAYDVFGRPTLVKAAEGKPEETRTQTAYSDVERRVVVRSDLNTLGDGRLVSVQHYDQLGRVRLARTLEDSSTQAETDETAGIKVQTRYKFSGTSSYVLTSNPYRAAASSAAGGESTMGWTLTTSDEGGRVIRMETFAGAGQPAPFAASNPNNSSTGAVVTAYDAEAVTVADQAGKQRRSVSDALGRLAQVFEAPNHADYNYQTSYTYDALGNLTQVAQGAQTRTFIYSSLSRLTSAQNPEGGTVRYHYDANGNLVLKLDPRPRPGSVTLPNCPTPYTDSQTATCYEYDQLGRVKSRQYNDGTPNVTYSYDTATNGKGRLASVSSSVSAYSYTAYDPLGRVRGSSQATDGVTYTMPDYQYDLAGNLVSEQYPSGRVVKTEYDAAGRVAGVKDQAAGLYYAGAAATDASNRIQYAAGGAASAVKLGNGLWEHTLFNSRLQPVRIGLGASATDSGKLRLDYTYGEIVNGTLDSTKNNGNLQSQRVYVAGALDVTQTYLYDKVNRLETAEEQAGPTSHWKQVYAYDQFGNRTLGAGTTYPSQLDAANNPQVSPATNRITSPGYAYDEAGNLLCDPVRSCAQSPLAAYYSYDAENKMRAAAGGFGGGGTTYSYDGDGRRVKKATHHGEVTVFVYDAAGRVVAEYSNQVRYNGTSYLTQDHLGSTRAVTGQDRSVRARHDYFPFGEEIGAGVGGRTTQQGYNAFDGVRMKFTGAERDDETGFDFMQARYYSSTQGRFTSPDVFWKDSQLVDPQSWNKYAYVRNNPLKYVDPTGEKATIKIETNEENKTATITITASIAIYSQGNSGYTQNQLNQAAIAIDSAIDGAWSGTFKGEDGITYTVKTDVDVQVYGSQEDAMKSGAQNVIGISRGDADPGRTVSQVDPRPLLAGESAPDTGTWKFDRVVNGRQGAHEFTHLLGAANSKRSSSDVSFNDPFTPPPAVYGNATRNDYHHALRGAINDHREASRARTEPCCAGYPGVRLRPVPYGPPRSRTSTRVVVAP